MSMLDTQNSAIVYVCIWRSSSCCWFFGIDTPQRHRHVNTCILLQIQRVDDVSICVLWAVIKCQRMVFDRSSQATMTMIVLMLHMHGMVVDDDYDVALNWPNKMKCHTCYRNSGLCIYFTQKERRKKRLQHASISTNTQNQNTKVNRDKRALYTTHQTNPSSKAHSFVLRRLWRVANSV